MEPAHANFFGPLPQLHPHPHPNQTPLNTIDLTEEASRVYPPAQYIRWGFDGWDWDPVYNAIQNPTTTEYFPGFLATVPNIARKVYIPNWECHKCGLMTKITDKNNRWTMRMPEICSDQTCGHVRCSWCYDLDNDDYRMLYCDDKGDPKTCSEDGNPQRRALRSQPFQTPCFQPQAQQLQEMPPNPPHFDLSHPQFQPQSPPIQGPQGFQHPPFQTHPPQEYHLYENQLLVPTQSPPAYYFQPYPHQYNEMMTF